MNSLKIVSVTFALALTCSAAHGQVNRRLQNAAERAAERAATQQTEKRVEKAVNQGIDAVLDGDKKDNQQQQQQQQQQAPAQQQQQQQAGAAQTPQQDPNAPPKLESFTQYDFVPGDQILFFEDFSQDAIGDFPALWTTNGAAEVRTINIAPGKWLHPTVPHKYFTYLNKIDFPQNFILEIDYIPTGERHGFGIDLYNEPGNKELDINSFPGDQGFRFYFTYNEWSMDGYKQDFDRIEGRSPKNLVKRNSVNHIVVWVQNRRVRVYHLGEKILDLPTVLPQNIIFNRLRLNGYGGGTYEDLPFISNIKVTTAAPDVRSKLLTEGKIISYGINFDSGKDVIKPESYGAIKSIADVLNENPDVRVRVVGHTDSDGNAAANLDLSKRRAEAVKESLSKNFGIAATRIETDGKGQTEPLAPNNTTEGKAKNRRVEFVKL